MLSLAAIVAWPFMENITSQQHLFGTEKDVHNGSSILHYKRGRSCSSFSIIYILKKKEKKKKTKKQQHSVHRHQSGEWRLPPAGCEASSCSSSSSSSSSSALQHALDSLVGWFIIQMLSCVPAGEREQTASQTPAHPVSQSSVFKVLLKGTVHPNKNTESLYSQPVADGKLVEVS